MKHLWGLFLAFSLILAACDGRRPVSAPKELTIFAAASLADAFAEIGKSFEASRTGVSVGLNFAGSQTLRTQIEQGAQADIFASANAAEMDALVAGGLVSTGAPRVFLSNQLVVILPADNAAGLRGVEGLSKSGLKLVLAAREVPAGDYSQQALGRLDLAIGGGYKEKVLANVVSYENDVKQVVAKVRLGEADAGIVYSSDHAAAPELQKIDIPAEYNVIARYPIAVLNQSKNLALAQAFVDYVLSPEGQAILEKWGFLPIP